MTAHPDSPVDRTLTRWRSTLARGAVVALALWCGGSALSLPLRRSLDTKAAIGQDTVSRFLDRLTPLCADLPALGAIGWLTDQSARDRLFPDDPQVEPWLSQLALWPRRLVPFADTAPGLEWVVADFADDAAVERTAASHGLAIVRSHGDGRAILRRRAAR